MRELIYLITLLGWPWLWQISKLSPVDFASAKDCGKCHEDIYRQWAQSMHSKSFTDPIYRQVFEEMMRLTGGERKGFCLSCHIPVASATRWLRRMPDPLDWQGFSETETEGVTCDFCHTISGNENLGKNISVGAYVYPHRGTTAIKYGRHADADSRSHQTEASVFLTSSEFCAICHKYKHPVRGTEIQDTYREWLRSPQGKRGMRCQDCHMSAYSGTTAGDGKERKEIHAHLFAGGHTEMVKKAATLAISASVRRAGNSRTLEINVNVTNSGAGHMIPTGIPGIREMWLEVEVGGPEKKVFYQEKVYFTQRLVALEGATALPWEAFKVLEDSRIPPQQTRQKAIRVLVPPGVSGMIKIRARMYDRLISEAMSRRLNIATPEPVLMAATETAVPVDTGKVSGLGNISLLRFRR